MSDPMSVLTRLIADRKLAMGCTRQQDPEGCWIVNLTVGGGLHDMSSLFSPISDIFLSSYNSDDTGHPERPIQFLLQRCGEGYQSPTGQTNSGRLPAFQNPSFAYGSFPSFPLSVSAAFNLARILTLPHSDTSR